MARVPDLPQGLDARYHAQGVLATFAVDGEGAASGGHDARVGARLRRQGGALFRIKAEDYKAQGVSVGGKSSVADATGGRRDTRQLAEGSHRSAEARVEVDSVDEEAADTPPVVGANN